VCLIASRALGEATILGASYTFLPFPLSLRILSSLEAMSEYKNDWD
jgi:hypothetical protein